MTSTVRPELRSSEFNKEAIVRQVDRLEAAQEELKQAISESTVAPKVEEVEYLSMKDGSMVEKLYRNKPTFNTGGDCSLSGYAWRSITSIARKVGG